MKKDNRKIAYIVTPEDFHQWTIYHYAELKKDGSVSSTSNISGYGKEQLLSYLDGTETVLQTGNIDIKFILKHNNSDVYGPNQWDINLDNESYIKKKQEYGAVQIPNPKLTYNEN